MVLMDWFKMDFEKFYENKIIDYNPALGISYRLRDPQHIWDDKISPTTYDLTAKEEISPDLDFIRGLYKNLRKTSEYGTPEEFNFKLKLAIIPLNPLNALGTFLYVHMGMPKSFCEQSKNPRKATSFVDKMGTSTIIWSLKNQKKPVELAFNYDFCNFPESSLRGLKGHNLDEFLKSISSENF